MGVVATTKKVITEKKRMMTKTVASYFYEKNKVTPSVATPRDTNPSDATGPSIQTFMASRCVFSNDEVQTLYTMEI